MGKELPKQRFILFSGKGGVGKTTCAAATALSASAGGKKTLLFSTDPAHSISDSLGVSLKGEITEVKDAANLWAVELDAKQSLEQVKERYGEQFVEFLSTVTYLDRGDIEEGLGLDIPGIDELMGLKTVMDYMDSQDFELYVWDTAPTGHTLRLLSLPGAFDQWIKLLARMRWRYKDFVYTLSGNTLQDQSDDLLFVLKKTVQRVSKLLRDAKFSKLVAVAVPERMVMAETRCLVKQLRQENIPVNDLVLNRVMPENPACPFCRATREEQQALRQEILRDFAGWNIREIYLTPGSIRGIDSLLKVAEELYK